MGFGEGAVPEIYYEFLCFRYVELEVVIKKPSGCLGYLLTVSVFVISPIMYVSSAYLRMVTEL